jgi:4-carboxymuconolactone decarboxylase
MPPARAGSGAAGNDADGFLARGKFGWRNKTISIRKRGIWCASRPPSRRATSPSCASGSARCARPRALVAFTVWRKFSGVPAPESDEGQDYSRLAEWTRRGEEVCATVYGENYRKLRESIRALHPAIDAWMIAEGYGRTLGRPGLDLMRRELCTVAQTCVLETPRQVHSHLRGALNAGASFGQIEGVLSIVNPLLSFDQWKKIKELWRTVREGWSPGN